MKKIVLLGFAFSLSFGSSLVNGMHFPSLSDDKSSDDLQETTEEFNPNSITHPDLETPMHDAAKRGDVSEAKFLLDKGAIPNMPDAMEKTPVEVAREAGHLDFVEFLEAFMNKNSLAKEKAAGLISKYFARRNEARAEVDVMELDDEQKEIIMEEYNRMVDAEFLFIESRKCTK